MAERLRAFAAFCYDFVIGDDWLIAVGVVIGLFQALTQVQEATLVFAPKILAIFLSLLLLMPMMGALMAGFMQQIVARIAGM